MSPVGPVYQAGTLSGNPLAVTAGIETLRLLRQPDVYERLEARARQLCDGVQDAARRAGVSVYATRVGSMFCTFFTDQSVTDYASTSFADTAQFRRYFHALIDAGIYVAPSQFEAAFLSTAHSSGDIAKTVKAARTAFKKLRA